MIWTIYFFILAYFLLGFIGFYFINRKISHEAARENWMKLGVYFIIIHILFFSIVFSLFFFRIISVIIIAGSYYELYKVYRRSGYRDMPFFLISVVVLSMLSLGFYLFSGLNFHLILFSFLILSIFDSFSQIAGQLWGRRKLFRKISPGKTIEGFLGGIIVALFSSYWLADLLAPSAFNPMRLATGIIGAAFIGDMITSFFKRRYDVKDFSNLIPGHGGFLDRFDSLIAGGAFVMLSVLILKL